MTKVSQAMHQGAEWCSPDTPISGVAKIMQESDIGAVPIGENDKLIGMVTDRDITCRAVASGADMSKMTARDVMSEGIIFCTEDEELDDAIHLMEDKRIRRLPVINKDKRMVGMLSLGDLSHSVSHELSGELLKGVADHH